jgi:hypothetical protein
MLDRLRDYFVLAPLSGTLDLHCGKLPLACHSPAPCHLLATRRNTLAQQPLQINVIVDHD